MNKYRIIFKTCYQYLFNNDTDIVDVRVDVRAESMAEADFMALDIIKVLERHLPGDNIYQIYDYEVKQV